MSEVVLDRKAKRKARRTKQRIERFEKRFAAYGEAHLYLAFHAAFPLILTPDLVYRIWINFDRDVYGRLLDVPWIATADLLLSDLCQEVGYELYEMRPEVREALRQRFDRHPRFAGEGNGTGTPRLDELAKFLEEYSIHQRLDRDDHNAQALADVHLWTALSHSDPARAAKEMTEALNRSVRADDNAEMLRMADLTAEIATRQETYKPLLVYLRGVEEFALGNRAQAAEQLAEMDLSQFEALGIDVVVPEIRLEEEERDDEAPVEERPAIGVKYVTGDRLGMRSEPNLLSEIIRRLPWGSEVTILAEDARDELTEATYDKIQVEDDIGYANAGFLSDELAAADLATISDDQQQYELEIVKILRERFNVQELEELCFILGVDYESLPGAVKVEKTNSLVQLLSRSGRLDELREEVLALRPDVVEWPEPTIQGLEPRYRAGVAQLLLNSFEEEAIEELYLRLEVEAERLPRAGGMTRASEFVRLVESQGRMGELRVLVEELRPGATWPVSPDEQRRYRSHLAVLLVETHNDEELEMLAFQFAVDREDLPAELPGMAQGLVRRLDRQRRLEELLAALRDSRPNIDWPEPPAASGKEVGVGTRYVTADKLNLRSGPGTAFDVLTVLESGAAVEVIEDGEWANVRAGDVTGYVASQFLAEERPAAKEAEEALFFGTPYVGPRAFTYEDREYFFGRDREIAELTGVIASYPLTLLHGPVGAGKSSLVHAGLVPSLREQAFNILGVGRVGGPSPVETRWRNVFMFNLVQSLDPASGPEDLATLTLNEFLSSGQFGPGDYGNEGDGARVLFIDHFDELLGHDGSRQSERENFLGQLQQAVDEDPELRIVLVIHDESFEEVTALLQRATGLSEKTIYKPLNLLDSQAAFEAVTRPAELAGRAFEPDAADALLAGLQEDADSPLLGTIEPLRLQVACYQLWQNLPADTRTISTADMQEVGVSRPLLSIYYESVVYAAASELGRDEGEIRNWIEYALIDENGRRAQVVQAREDVAGMEIAVANRLVSDHLLQDTVRGGVVWYELGQERMIETILASNRAWRERRPEAAEDTVEASGRSADWASLDEKVWQSLAQYVREGRCLPILGETFLNSQLTRDTAGGPLLDERIVARLWADDMAYPFAEAAELPRLAQYLRAKVGDAYSVADDYLAFLKSYLLAAAEGRYGATKLIEELRQQADTTTVTTLLTALTLVDQSSEGYRALKQLADWPLTLYVTTSYHTFIEDALLAAGKKPRSEICNWHATLEADVPSVFETDPGYTPSVAEPLVYHQFGIDSSPESLVLAEDDFIAWFMALAEDSDRIPPVILKALAGSAPLLLGHSPDRLAFKVLYQAFFSTDGGRRRLTGVYAAGREFTDSEPSPFEAEGRYLARYFGRSGIDVYQGNGGQFISDLGTLL